MSVIEKRNWAVSAENRAIALFQSDESPQNPILLIGGVHGDEPEGVWLAEATLQWLKSNTSENLKPWMLILCLNPDGFAKGERTNGHGVDLNRNYPSRDWSPEAAKPRYHPGPHPASEPEVRTLVALIRLVEPQLIIHCHSWNPCVVYAGDPARPAAEALGRSSGYEVRDDIGYPTPGSLSRFGWHDNKIPIICIEEAEGTPREKVWPHFAQGMSEVFRSEGSLK
jgi:protein MpaA